MNDLTCPDCRGIGGDPLGEDCSLCNGCGRVSAPRETFDPEAVRALVSAILDEIHGNCIQHSTGLRETAQRVRDSERK